jgi:hypothetical protein
MPPPHPAGLRVLLRFFRLESHRLQLPKGVRRHWPFRRRSAWDSHFKRIHSCDPGCRAKAVERAFTRSRRDRTDAQRGQLLHDIFFWLSGLSTNILTNSPLDLKKELTSTLLALREQSIVHVQLKRITSYLRILQNAVRRLKGLPCQEPRPTV